MSEKTSPQPSNLIKLEETIHVEAEHAETEHAETEPVETEHAETVKDVDHLEKLVDGDGVQKKPDNQVCTDSTSPVKPLKTPASLAECIAKEAKLKASKIISKNERVQEEFDGIGKNIDVHPEECNDLNEHEKSYHEGVENEEERDENVAPLTPEEIKKKIMRGAKPVMPMNDEELMKKLKEKYNKLSAE